MRKPNVLKQRLNKGETVLGLWCVIPSPTVINVISTTGFDFVIIDLEHGPAGFETAENMICAANSEDCSTIIRLNQVDEENILKSFDIGTHGILVAHIETPRSCKRCG